MTWRPTLNSNIAEAIRELEEEMVTASNNLEFEKAALVRDQIRELKRALDAGVPHAGARGADVEETEWNVREAAA